MNLTPIRIFVQANWLTSASIHQIESLCLIYQYLHISQQRICNRTNRGTLMQRVFHPLRRPPDVIKEMSSFLTSVLISKKSYMLQITVVVALLTSCVLSPTKASIQHSFSELFLWIASSISWLQDPKEPKCLVEINNR